MGPSGYLLRKLSSSARACRSSSGSRRRFLQTTGSFPLEAPKNEPILNYTDDPKSDHRIELEKCLGNLSSKTQEVPIVINGIEYRSQEVRFQALPYRHQQKVAAFFQAPHKLIQQAIQAALEARREWQQTALEERLAVFERAAELVSGKYRQQLNAATIMGQAKTIKQAEIDSAAELADFLRFNSYYVRKLLAFSQPISSELEKNSINFRGLDDGFVAAISPFNFTAIGGNLASAPVLFGNCVVWKPSDTAILSSYLVFKIFLEAGLPAGVINFVPSEGLDFGRVITANRKLAGVNFTGSLATFQWLWNEVGFNIKHYDSFPRLVGECGGKNFHLVHPSADLKSAIAQTIRSAFEYSGQKCSACSRLYVPESLWLQAGMRDQMVSLVKSAVKVGPADELDTSYTSAVIDERAFKRVAGYINYGKALERAAGGNTRLLVGGDLDASEGYYVQPTIFETQDHQSRLLQEEIFGPVLTVFPYQDEQLERTLELLEQHKFALTGSIFAQDQAFIERAKRRLRMSCGNLYINDKSTGAVVGQQPFGGARHSGTNDKAGGPHYLMRWCSQQTLKETKTQLPDI